MCTRRDFLRTTGMAAGAALMPGALRANVLTTAGSGIAGPNSLRAHAAARGLFVGCAVDPSWVAGNSGYRLLVADQCSIIVPENAMKWGPVCPAPGKYDFHQADTLMDFAAHHGQKVRGHNLIWHDALPKWFPGPITKANARQAMTAHIQTEMRHFSGRIHSWDVVNEAIEPNDGRADNLRKSPWFNLVGPDYVDLAYRTARRADPNALLTYNDFGIEYPHQERKRAAVISLVQGMKSRGVPLDAVGIQSHIEGNVPAPGAELRAFVREMAKLNLQVFITELDVNDQKVPGTIAERDAAVAKIYRDYLTMMLAEPNVKAVLTWGVTDGHSWLNDWEHLKRADRKPLRPLPFDPEMRPTPVFFAERAAIDSRAV